MSDFSLPDSLDHLILHLRRIDCLIQSYNLTRVPHSDNDNQFPGLVINKNEFERLFIDSDSQTQETEPDFMKISLRYNCLCAEINELEAAALEHNIPMRLIEIEKKFDLNKEERDILLLALAPDVDKKYEKIFGYIQDDITMRLPCIDMALSLLFTNLTDKLRARTIFNNSSPLLYHKLIELENDPGRILAFPAQYIRVNKRIAAYLLDTDQVDFLLEKTVKRIIPKAKMTDLVLPDSVKKFIDSVSGISPFSKIIYIQGNPGTGKRTLAESLTGLWNLNLLYLDNIPSGAFDIDLFTQLLCREAYLWGAVILVQNIETSNEQPSSILRALISWARQYCTPLIICGKDKWEPGDLIPLDDFIALTIPPPSTSDRQIIWNSRLNGNAPPDGDSVLKQIASTFKISGNQINKAVATALRYAYTRNPGNPSVNASDLYYACRVHSSAFLSRNARKITTRYCWNDIVLPEEKIEQLRELCSNIRYQSVVYNDWGYESKLSLGKGVHALFAGPSGTGKTMAAEIIAAELGVDLYKIDLASVVSKYIGETEKNLSQIFDEAEESNVILFFDEADALLGKRSEVKDAHDRYANIEISYLLQRMEEFSGISLLATNFRKNIDDAFIRRIRYIVEFPFPDQKYRKMIWMGIWPPHAPFSIDIDYDFLSYQFELSGGNIRNVALNASFIAAGQNQSINMSHILLAIKREFQKMGKVFLNENFGRYSNLFLQNA